MALISDSDTKILPVESMSRLSAPAGRFAKTTDLPVVRSSFLSSVSLLSDVRGALEIQLQRAWILEFIGHRRHYARIRIDLHDAFAEDQRTVNHAVVTDLEAIQATRLVDHQTRRLATRQIDLVERVPVEHESHEQALAVPRKRNGIQAALTLPQLANRLARRLCVKDAVLDGSPYERAVRTERQIIGHALRRALDRLELAGLRVDSEAATGQ